MANHASLEAGVVATEVLILSRGLRVEGDTYTLSDPSAQRAAYAVNYFHNHRPVFEERAGLLVTPTSYTPHADYPREPKENETESFLIANHLYEYGVPGRHVHYEGVAGTTLQEVLYIGEQQPFGECRQFTPDHPMGLIMHDSQADRGVWLAKKVLRLPDRAIMPLIVPGEDTMGIGMSERHLLLFTQIILFGARSHRAMRRREAFGRRVFGAVVRNKYTIAPTSQVG